MEGRNGQVWAEWCAGHNQDQIADTHGISQQRVSQIIAAVRATIAEEDLADRRQRHLEVVDQIRAETLRLIQAPMAPAYSNGRMMLDETGAPILDVGPRLAAMDRAGKFLDREAKLLGLDAATKVDVAVSEQAKQAGAEAAAAAIARLTNE